MTAADRDWEAFEAWFKTADNVVLDRYWAEEEWEAAITYARAQAGEPVAWADVLAERQRQTAEEGWTPEHDDGHSDGSLALAAACYAQGDILPSRSMPSGMVPFLWPKSWHPSWWKPSQDRRHNLVKAGALILAEIERLDRLSKKD